MFSSLYILTITILILFCNRLFLKKNFLINETGDRHQKFASKSKIPLTGGIFLILGLFYYLNENIYSLILFSILILILGILSDLKLIYSAKKRLIYQITIVLIFVVFNDLKILNTKIYILDEILLNNYFNFIFVSFCILIVINGSNFLDGLNTLNVGYFLSITLLIYFLNFNKVLIFEGYNLEYFALLLFIIFILNFFNKIYLGDSGSYVIGFIFSIFLIKLYILNQNISPFFIVLLLWYPSFETLFSIVRKNIMSKSPMKPDSNHLHQQIFFFIKKKFKIKTLYANLVTANLINTYNVIIFCISLNFIKNSQILVLLILLNLSLYIFIYFKLFVIRYKNI